MNDLRLFGRVGQNPELKYLDSGVAVCKFSLATRKIWKDKQGKPQEETQWHNIVAWGKQGEIIKEHVIKGDQLLVNGEVQYRNYEKDGVKQYFTEIKLLGFEFVSVGKGKAPTSKKEETSNEPDVDEIPF